MNQHGSCELKCGDDWEMKRYNTGGLLGIDGVIGLGHEVCCCAPKLVLPTLPTLPSITLPSLELPSIPSIALPSIPSLPAVELPSVPLGPSFDDTEFDPSDHSHAPKCVYLFADLLKSNIDKTFQETSR